ncbi:MAG: hypothetical protein NTW98_00315 [Candidatus Nomurabacteria bacterium]|nr:hypothetical protein [Candidatus Nomurabacteria bacterium]
MKKNSSEQEKIAQELLDRLVEQELNNNIKKWNAELAEVEEKERQKMIKIIVYIIIFLIFTILIFGLWYTTSEAAKPFRLNFSP